jgi:hypothetical protein
MKIRELAEECVELPTIMGFEDEVRVIRLLQEVPLFDIRDNLGLFDDILCKLSDAHGDYGMFCVTEDNQSFFWEFADWLRSVERRVGQPLAINADMFSYSMQDLEEFFGPPRPDQPSSPA